MESRQDSAEYINLRSLASRLSRRKWWIVGSVIVGLICGIAGAILMKPMYRSAVVVMPAANTDVGLGSELGGASMLGGLGGLGGLASLAGFSLQQSDARTNEALAILESRDFTERFIQSNGLLPELFPRKWDAGQHKWKVAPVDIPTLDDAWKLFDKHIRKVDQNDKTELVTLSIDWSDRVAAADWANALIDQLNSVMRNRAIHDSTLNLGYLDAELSQTRTVELKDSIERLIEAEQEKQMLATVMREYAFRTVDRAIPAPVNDPIIKRSLLIEIGILFGLIVGLSGAMFDWL